MARGINKVILVGNLGGDPEVKYSQGGTAIANFSIATTEAWKDKQTGEQQERTEWTRVTIFGRLAEIAGEYLKKGRQVYIEGSLRTDKFTDKEGIERYVTKVIANEMQLLGGAPREGRGDAEPARPARERPEPPRGGQRSDRRLPPQQEQAPPSRGDSFEDDDIPF